MGADFIISEEGMVPILKVVKYDFDSEIKQIKIYVFADWHIGDCHSDIKSIIAMIEEVRLDKSAYVILDGDLLNNATKTSVSDVYSENVSPMEQEELLVRLLMPVKDKILFGCTGNHEGRTYKQDGIDIMAIVMKDLGLLDRYAAEGGVVFVRFGCDTENHRRKYRYSLFCTHGTGGGKKEGGKINRLADLVSIIDTDIYIHAHTHLPGAFKEDFLRVDNNNSTVNQVTKLFVNTSAQLNYGGYGQTACFKPSCKDNPTIYLSGEKKDMYAIV